jgi:hypothetical protein
LIEIPADYWRYILGIAMSITIGPKPFIRAQPVAQSSVSRAGKSAIRFTLAELSRLGESEVKLGRFTCRELEQALVSCFDLSWKESHQMREFFPGGLPEFLTKQTAMPVGKVHPRIQLRYGVQSEFTMLYAQHFEEKTGVDLLQIMPLTDIYMALRTLQEKIKARQAADESSLDLIQNANRLLAEKTERLDFTVEITD